VGNDSTHYQQDEIVKTEMKSKQINIGGITSGQIIEIQRKSYQIPLSEVIVFGAGNVNNIEDKKEDKEECTVEQQTMLGIENEHMSILLNQVTYIIRQIYVADLVK